MGKVTIVSEQGKGEYTATLDYDLQRVQDRIAALDTQITDLDTQITAQIVVVANKQTAVDDLKADLNAAINAGQDLDALTDIVKSMQGPASDLSAAKRLLRKLRLDKLAAQKQRTWLSDNTPATTAITVWCADYTEGLSGEVGTAEVMGEPTAPPIIQPGTATGTASAYDQTRDYIMQPAIGSGGAAVYYNRAFLPAWQKWMPTYRIGTIDSKTGDECDLTLDTSLSVEQGLDVNQTATLSAVPIEYMYGNGSVFEPGDRVLVKFENQDWSQPKVIGFETNPKPELLIHVMESSTTGNTNGESVALICNEYGPDGLLRKNVFNYGSADDELHYGLTRAPDDSLYWMRQTSNVSIFKDGVSLGSVNGLPGDIDTITGSVTENGANIFVTAARDGSGGDDNDALLRCDLSANYQATIATSFEDGTNGRPLTLLWCWADDTMLITISYQNDASDPNGHNRIVIHDLNGAVDTVLEDKRYNSFMSAAAGGGAVACVSNDKKRLYVVDSIGGEILVADLENKTMLSPITDGTISEWFRMRGIAATARNVVATYGGWATRWDLKEGYINLHIWDVDDLGVYTKRPDTGADLESDFYSTERNVVLIG